MNTKPQDLRAALVALADRVIENCHSGPLGKRVTGAHQIAADLRAIAATHDAPGEADAWGDFNRAELIDLVEGLSAQVNAYTKPSPPTLAEGDARDAARLDWLAENFKTCTIRMNGQHPWHPHVHKLSQLRGPTFRAAIDAARHVTEQGERNEG